MRPDAPPLTETPTPDWLTPEVARWVPILQTRRDAVVVAIAPHTPGLIAVTKSASLPQMLAAYAVGFRNFGENRVQDALQKQAALPPSVVQSVDWHLIGPLQRNKAVKTVGRFDCIQSVDRVDLAEKLSALNVAADRQQKILLQVNVARDPAKSGVLPEHAEALLQAIRNLPGIRIDGLMTIGRNTRDPAELTETFTGLRTLRDSLSQASGLPLRDLSMGMSHDYVHASACGATMLRIGTLLFQGEEDRPASDSAPQSTSPLPRQAGSER